jgi:hypothetical protein
MLIFGIVIFMCVIRNPKTRRANRAFITYRVKNKSFVFSRNVFIYILIFYIIILTIFQNECQLFIFFIWRKHDEKFEPSDPYIFVKTPLYFLFYFFEIPEIFPYKTPDLEYVNFATPCINCLYVLKFSLCSINHGCSTKAPRTNPFGALPSPARI